MSAGGNSGSGTTIQEIPAWLQQEYQANVASAKNVAGQGFTPYGGQMAAGDNDYLAAARDQAAASGRVGQDERTLAAQRFGEAGNMSPMFIDAAQTGDVLDVSPERAQAGNITAQGLQQYQNPYTQQVVDTALSDIDLQRRRSLNESNASTPSGAFGGSRQGVSDALTNEGYGRVAAQTAAGLRSDGFNTAAGLMTSDLNRQAGTSQFNAAAGNAAMTGNADRDIMARISDADRRQAASYANQQNELATAGINLQGAQGLLSTANDKQQGTFNTQSALQSAGGQLQGQQQSGLDALYSEFMRGQNAPIQGQQLVSQAVLGINNAGGTTTSNSKGKGYSL